MVLLGHFWGAALHFARPLCHPPCILLGHLLQRVTVAARSLVSIWRPPQNAGTLCKNKPSRKGGKQPNQQKTASKCIFGQKATLQNHTRLIIEGVFSVWGKKKRPDSGPPLVGCAARFLRVQRLAFRVALVVVLGRTNVDERLPSSRLPSRGPPAAFPGFQVWMS